MKAKFIALFILMAGIILSCNPYKRVSITGSDFYGRNKVIKNIDRYDVFVHQDEKTYKLEQAKHSDSTQISGQISPLPAEDSVVVKVDPKRIPAEERNDIHIYVNNDFKQKLEEPSDTVRIDVNDIREVKLAAKRKMGTLGIVITIVLGVIVLALLAFALIIGVIILASDNTESNSGNSDSGGSDSGNSNSGNSDSGNSDSGGSDSGCYVATMAYGSYDAPQVMVLRKFRDQFLQKFAGGRAFIQWYYKNSPGFVQKHQSKLWLHAVLRRGLDLFVWVLKPLFR